jgi:hypothetical protein
MTEIQTAAETVAPARRVYSEAEKAAFRKGFGQEIGRQKRAEARTKAIRTFYAKKRAGEAAKARAIGAWAAKKAAERASAQA